MDSSVAPPRFPLVRARNLAFSYPGAGAPAFGPIDFHIDPGEIVLLLGPSGCGKSTLALCLNGLIPHLIGGNRSGELSVDGVDPGAVSVPEMARRAGILFQDPESQICTLTVADEVAFGPENLRRDPADLPDLIASSLASAGLDLSPGTPTGSLSGGMKQRLAAAAVTACGPRLLILDEPTAHLDPAGAGAFFRSIDALRRETGAGILLIEHRVDEVAGIVDRVIVMNAAGRLEREGPPAAVFGGEKAGDAAPPARPVGEAVWLPRTVEVARQAGLPFVPLTPDALAAGCGPQTAAELLAALQRRTTGTDSEGRDPEDSDLKNGTASASPPLLRLRGIEYGYPEGAPVLRRVDLDLRRGEIHALVGPNGSGKSTLALIAAGLIRPDAGTVEAEGAPLANRRISAWRSESPRAFPRAGYVFQNPEHQFVAGTVAEEVAFGLRESGLPEEEIDRRVAALLERFGLTGVAGRHPFRLSGGQKRRLSVAAMLVEEPALLVLDEPTFGQDRVSQRAMTEEIRRLRADGRAILLITHDMRLVAETAGRVTALGNGVARFTGSPRGLFEREALLAELSLAPPPDTRIAAALRQLTVDS